MTKTRHQRPGRAEATHAVANDNFVGMNALNKYSANVSTSQQTVQFWRNQKLGLTVFEWSMDLERDPGLSFVLAKRFILEPLDDGWEVLAPPDALCFYLQWYFCKSRVEIKFFDFDEARRQAAVLRHGRGTIGHEQRVSAPVLIRGCSVRVWQLRRARPVNLAAPKPGG